MNTSCERFSRGRSSTQVDRHPAEEWTYRFLGDAARRLRHLDNDELRELFDDLSSSPSST